MMLRNAHLLMLLLLSSPGDSPIAKVSPCDPTVRPLLQSAHHYRQRGDRCEGLYVAEISRPGIELVSFTLGSLAFDWSSKTVLLVDSSSHTSPVRVRAVAIPPRSYYRMDAILPGGARLRWPLADVLFPEGLTARRIGVFGWTERNQIKTFVPVRLSTVGEKTADQRLPPLLIVQPDFDAARVKWRWSRLARQGCSRFGPWADAVSAPVRALWPVKIDLSSVSPGLNCLEVVAQAEDTTEWPRLAVRVEIMPR